MAKTNSFDEMVKSILALILLFVLYTWSTRVLHLNVFLLDAELFNFFILYLPSLIFFSSLFFRTERRLQRSRTINSILSYTSIRICYWMVRIFVPLRFCCFLLTFKPCKAKLKKTLCYNYIQRYSVTNSIMVEVKINWKDLQGGM